MKARKKVPPCPEKMDDDDPQKAGENVATVVASPPAARPPDHERSSAGPRLRKCLRLHFAITVADEVSACGLPKRTQRSLGVIDDKIN
jgi:hypothetical protein